MKRIIFAIFIFLIVGIACVSADGFDDVSELTGYRSFEDIEKGVSDGKQLDFKMIFAKIGDAVAGDMRSSMASAVAVIAFSTLAACVKGVGIKNTKGSDEVVFLAVYCVISALLLNVLKSSVEIASQVANSVIAFVKMSVPSYIAITACTMPTVASTGFGGVFIMMLNIVSAFAGDFMLNLFFYIGVMYIINNMSKEIHVLKLVDFVRQTLFWILGFLLTIFAGLMGLSGITTSATSSCTMSAAKYAVGHTVPVVGGFLADSADMIYSSALLLKSSFGVAGIIIIVCMCILPVIKLFVSGMILKATAGIMEPYCDKRICDCTSSVGQTIIHIMAIVILICVIFIFAVAVLILTGNR